MKQLSNMETRWFVHHETHGFVGMDGVFAGPTATVAWLSEHALAIWRVAPVGTELLRYCPDGWAQPADCFLVPGTGTVN